METPPSSSSSTPATFTIERRWIFVALAVAVAIALLGVRVERAVVVVVVHAVVVVEDERIMSTFILGNLRRLGILDLFALEDGAAALRDMASIKPDLILTDVHMQPMGGLEFVRRLRASSHAQLANTPVINDG